MNPQERFSQLETTNQPAHDLEPDTSEKIISEINIENQEGLHITAYEKYIPDMLWADGSILSKAYTIEGYRTIAEDLTIDAQREKGTNSDYSITFIDTDHGHDFQSLSGKGMFNAKRQIEPFIRFIDRETGGKWHASCDDKKRMRVYARWLPENKIKYE